MEKGAADVHRGRSYVPHADQSGAVREAGEARERLLFGMCNILLSISIIKFDA